MSLKGNNKRHADRSVVQRQHDACACRDACCNSRVSADVSSAPGASLIEAALRHARERVMQT